MADLADQERSELLRQCSERSFFWHSCDDEWREPCGACEEVERLQRMSAKELAEELARIENFARAQRFTVEKQSITAEELHRRFVERFGE